MRTVASAAPNVFTLGEQRHLPCHHCRSRDRGGVAGLAATEEAAFRGYGQVLLERRFPPVAAVALSSLFFALYHGPTQGFQPSKIAFYFTVGVVFGTIGYLTGSVLPAIPVHIAGDLLFFTSIWPQDAGPTLVWTHGADSGFWLNVAQTLVLAGLALLAFRHQRAVTRPVAGGSATTGSAPGPGYQARWSVPIVRARLRASSLSAVLDARQPSGGQVRRSWV